MISEAVTITEREYASFSCSSVLSFNARNLRCIRLREKPYGTTRQTYLHVQNHLRSLQRRFLSEYKTLCLLILLHSFGQPSLVHQLRQLSRLLPALFQMRHCLVYRLRVQRLLRQRRMFRERSYECRYQTCLDSVSTLTTGETTPNGPQS